MFLITDIKNLYQHSTAEQHLGKRRKDRLFSSLTWAILAFNTFALAVLAGTVFYANRYQDILLSREVELLEAQASIYTDAILENALSVDKSVQGQPEVYLDPIKARSMLLRFSDESPIHFKLLMPDGTLLADSLWWSYQGESPQQVQDLSAEQKKRNLEVAGDLARAALDGEKGRELLRFSRRNIHVQVAEPMTYGEHVVGALVVGVNVDYLKTVRRTMGFDILMVFFGTLALTVIISVNLARKLGKPLQDLAEAADKIRHEAGQAVEVPDYTMRDDEIGDLSSAMREMTQALQARLMAIERFAADVSHELKNPLTSLRSALETLPKVKDEKKRAKLEEIIAHDLMRMDRLITDISNVSRLDAQLIREHMEQVNLKDLLRENTHKQYEMMSRLVEEGRMKYVIDIRFIDATAGEKVVIRGLPLRLNQVFDNVLVNALSFSPEEGAVTVTLMRDDTHAIITIDDEGPGIPPEKMETIFERFYTDRPIDEQFGNSSGLGLNICLQIVEAHKGKIWAENRTDEDGKVLGARFIISFHLDL